MRRVIQAVGRVLLASTLTMLTACGSSSHLDGVYTVTSIDGESLPARWDGAAELREGGVMLKDGRYVAMLDLAGAGEAEPLRMKDGGTFRIRGEELEFQTDQAAGGAVASFLGAAVVLSEGRAEADSLVLKLRGHRVVAKRTEQ